MTQQSRNNPADLILMEQWAKRNLCVTETREKAQEILGLIEEIRTAMDDSDEERANSAARRLALEAIEVAQSQDLTPWDLFANKPN